MSNCVFRAAMIFAGLLLSVAAPSTFSQTPGQYPGHPPGGAPPQGQYPGRPPGGWTPGSHPGFTPPNGTGAPLARAASVRSGAPVAQVKPSAGEQFFIVASIDLQKSQLLLKHPTEVTLLVKISGTTQILDDAGKPLKLADLRAGDTVWVTSSGSGDNVAANRVRKGEMTVADLHQHYLDYPEIK
jgi:hypothetical protein